MIYLDTHVVVWLYAFGSQKLSERARELIEQSDKVLISPMVLLEMQLLYEIGKLTVGPESIHKYLIERRLLEVCRSEFEGVIEVAVHQTWTRDPFDRVITAQAALNESILLTKDGTILDNYSRATW